MLLYGERKISRCLLLGTWYHLCYVEKSFLWGKHLLCITIFYPYTLFLKQMIGVYERSLLHKKKLHKSKDFTYQTEGTELFFLLKLRHIKGGSYLVLLVFWWLFPVCSSTFLDLSQNVFFLLNNAQFQSLFYSEFAWKPVLSFNHPKY